MNPNIRANQERSNVLLTIILNMIPSLLYSYSRLLLEVFIRKNMGRRYFSFASYGTMVLFLLFFPVGVLWVYPYFLWFPRRHFGASDMDYLQQLFEGWYYLFIVFTIAGFVRWLESLKKVIINLSESSVSSGESYILKYWVKWFGNSVTPRQVETIVEPSFCFLIGLVIYFFSRCVGETIMGASFFYSLSYFKKVIG
ncbi:MAG: hypothetical protein A1D16_10270 [Flavihumibacter sp. CACIAM 22H1]|nr:MAG: hypothetical protein A1D16_10270 [Flavihumibacter sp. CACIAM 22H1]